MPVPYDSIHTGLQIDSAVTEVLNAGTPNTLATLDGTGKVPTSQLPSAILGAVDYQGTWNAATNTPTLASGVGTKGFYYIVNVAGTTAIDTHALWNIGDWIVFDGTVWERVAGTIPDATSGAKGIIQLTQDLGNTAAAPKVVGIQGVAVNSAAPAQNQVLSFNAANNDYELVYKMELQACKAVATSNVSSLSGTTTIDSVSLSAGDRVLLTAQSTASQNGPWTIAAGAWTRPIMYPSGQSVPAGSWVSVYGGGVYANSDWQITGTGAVTVDTTSTTWAQLFPIATATVIGLIKLVNDLGGTAALPTVVGLGGHALPSNISDGFLKWNTAGNAWEEVTYGTAADTVCQGNDSRLSNSRAPNGSASGDLGGTFPGPTVAKIQGNSVASGTPTQNQELIWNAANSDFELVHKTELQFCRAVATSNVSSLSGTTTIDGVSLSAGDRVLLTAQSTASQNGLWTVQSSTWTRPISYAAGQAVVQGSWVTISTGTTFANSDWQLVASASITVDTTGTTWAQLFPLSTASIYGLIKLAGNLGGTAALPTVVGTIAGAITMSGGLTMSSKLTVSGPVTSTPTAITFGSTTNIDFTVGPVQTIALTGAITLTTSNLAAGAEVQVILTADSGGPYNLTVPGWKVFGAALPSNIPASKSLILSLKSTSTTDAACYVVGVAQV